MRASGRCSPCECGAAAAPARGAASCVHPGPAPGTGCCAPSRDLAHLAQSLLDRPKAQSLALVVREGLTAHHARVLAVPTPHIGLKLEIRKLGFKRVLSCTAGQRNPARGGGAEW
jgi:hypothetical protein